MSSALSPTLSSAELLRRRTQARGFPRAQAVLRAVVRAFQIDEDGLFRNALPQVDAGVPVRGEEATRVRQARRVLALMLVDDAGMSTTAAGALLRVDHTTIIDRRREAQVRDLAAVAVCREALAADLAAPPVVTLSGAVAEALTARHPDARSKVIEALAVASGQAATMRWDDVREVENLAAELGAIAQLVRSTIRS